MTVDDRFGPELEETRRNRLRGTVSEIVTDPVSDWATDFSHVDPQWAADPYPIQDDLRQRCPIAHTERFGGVWLPTRYEDVAAIAYDTERFSSRAIIVGNVKPPRELAPVGAVPPISSDPPFHHDARKLLLPAFTKTAVARREESTRALCHELIDGLEGREVVDAAREYAQHIPMRVIADMLGFPAEDADRFRRFVENALESVNEPTEKRLERFAELSAYLVEQIHDHLADPRDDLTTYLLDAELNGAKLDPVHVVGTMTLLLIAGIDTTWSAIGASLWHLAKTPEDRRRL
ncbi:cytochrome P450, partial [Nonomuraea sp. NPDC052265]|uniref:cytochrome P450 n=1 Tax=Nonomuraea sp. NPDC052265 TaxID=3364374 RepID=UPI0037C886BE